MIRQLRIRMTVLVITVLVLVSVLVPVLVTALVLVILPASVMDQESVLDPDPPASPV